MMRNSHFAFIAVLFSILYLAIRIPIYPERMQGEDGGHAAIFLLQPTVPGYLLMGRVNGKNIFGDVIHPAATFEVLKISGPITTLSKTWQSLSPYWITTWSRLVCSLYLLASLLLFLPLSFRLAKSEYGTSLWRSGLLILAVLGNSSFAAYCSASIQLDNTAGVLLTSILACAILAGLVLKQTRGYLAVLFSASAIFGLGKNEWSIILWLALAFLSVWLALLPQTIERGREDRSSWIVLLGVVFVGSVTGNFLNYLLSPSAYIGGLELMLTGGGAAGGTWSEKAQRWLEFTLRRIPFLVGHLGCFFLTGLSLLLRRRPVKIQIALVLVLALGLFSLYFASLALPMPRYFAPAYVAAVATLLAVRMTSWDERCKLPLWFFLITMTFLSARFALRRYDITFRQNFVDLAFPRPNKDCVPGADGIAMLSGEDFVFAGISRAGAVAFLKENRSIKPLCQ